MNLVGQKMNRLAVSNTSKMSVGEIIKPPPWQECKTQVLFCLIAQEAPALLRQLTDQTVNASNSAMLECQVRGIPEPQISWFKNHEEIQQEPGESFVYSPTSYSRLFIYPSPSSSHLQSHWQQYLDVRKAVRQQPCSSRLFCLTPKHEPGWKSRHNRSLWNWWKIFCLIRVISRETYFPPFVIEGAEGSGGVLASR